MIPASTLAHWRYPRVTFADIRTELEREAGLRARLYGKRVETGRMTQAEADYETAAVAALKADLEMMLAGVPPGSEEHGLTWQQRRGAILRELDKRAHVYPGLIANGNMTEAEASWHTECLLALLEIYNGGWGWKASNGARPSFGSLTPTPEQEEARREWEEVEAALAAAGDEARQGQLL